MRSGLFFKIFAVVVVLGISVYLACVVYAKFTQSSRLKQAATAAEQFHAKEGLYGQLLANWAEIMPAKCGRSGSTPGIVFLESITRESDGGISIATNDASVSHVSSDEAARRLNAKPEAVNTVLSSLNLVGSVEIIQSGAEVKIISPENDTHGYLHIDESCPDAGTYAFWSQQPGNFKADNPGHYIGLKSLGSSWYYYMEQR